MGSRAAQQALVPGRLVLTQDMLSGAPELGVVLGSVPNQGVGSGAPGQPGM